jgi:hypothetical protein
MRLKVKIVGGIITQNKIYAFFGPILALKIKKLVGN